LIAHRSSVPAQAEPVRRPPTVERSTTAAKPRVPIAARILCLSVAVALFCLRYPSLHFAATFVLFLYARSRGRLWGILGLAYSLAMALALVYLGERYVVDCALGGVVALVVWHVGESISSPRNLSRQQSPQTAL